MKSEKFLDGRVTLHLGDCIEAMQGMESDSVDCVVTSPPYWWLRDYGVEGQLGLEPTLGEHLQKMVAVFEEVKRVLKPSGTCFVNYGDCYAQNKGGTEPPAQSVANGNRRSMPTYGKNPTRDAKSHGLKHKDLCMVPNRFAIAMQESGWWVRSEIIWAKANPMPESVTDRPATAHEKIFMFTKAPRYFWDADAVRQGMSASSVKRLSQDIESQAGSLRANGGTKTNGPMKAVGKRTDKQRGHSRRHAGFNDRWDAMPKAEQSANGRNLRNYEPAPVEVWNIATHAFSEAHFATFPPELAKRCILAGCPEKGSVLDPFGGSGTTGMVAVAMGRSAHLIELNPEYAQIARARIEGVYQGPEERRREAIKRKGLIESAGPLFAESDA